MTVQEHLLAAEAHFLMAEERLECEHVPFFALQDFQTAKKLLEKAIMECNPVIIPEPVRNTTIQAAD